MYQQYIACVPACVHVCVRAARSCVYVCVRVCVCGGASHSLGVGLTFQLCSPFHLVFLFLSSPFYFY